MHLGIVYEYLTPSLNWMLNFPVDLTDTVFGPVDATIQLYPKDLYFG